MYLTKSVINVEIAFLYIMKHVKILLYKVTTLNFMYDIYVYIGERRESENLPYNSMYSSFSPLSSFIPFVLFFTLPPYFTFPPFLSLVPLHTPPPSLSYNLPYSSFIQYQIHI